jgi:hypothetical protein
MQSRQFNAPHRIDVASKCDLELTRRQIPEFNCSVIGACAKERVIRRYAQTPDPSLMGSNYSVQLKWLVPCWLDKFSNRRGFYSSQFGCFS